ncbi:hypothetical protein RhiirB3_409186 [Rhizophagus irregularis]|nr:hypothetical protein RhiirB3_409186 [Rhizophagus irregularis]
MINGISCINFYSISIGFFNFWFTIHASVASRVYIFISNYVYNSVKIMAAIMDN